MSTQMFNFSTEVHRLSNGMTVALESLPYLHSFSAGVWIRTGSENESESLAGLAHFLEHLLFKGTIKRNVHQLMEAIEGRGGHLNAFTSRENTCLYVKMLDKHLPIGIEILADIFKNSQFGDWEKERNVVLEEIASVEDTPDEHIHDLLSSFHWPDHPLGRPVSGSAESVSSLTRDHVLEFFDQWYQPENVVISIAGNFDPVQALAQIREEFETIPSKAVPGLPDAPKFQGGIHVSDRDISQTHLCMAFPGPKRDCDTRYVCDMTSSILGGGSTSRLFERIREEEGLAYSIYTFPGFQRTVGMIGMYAATAPNHLSRALELSYEEYRRIRDELVPEEELEMHREQIKGNMLMALESTFTRMSRTAQLLMYYGRIIPVDEVLEKVDAVTQADVQAFARSTFVKDQCAVVVLGPQKEVQITDIDL